MSTESDLSEQHAKVAFLMARAARAVDLRKSGMSHRAVASATGMSLIEARRCCKGVQPTVMLPDLPGMPPLGVTRPEIVAKIQQLRTERHAFEDIARALGVSVAVVARYAPDATRQAVHLRMKGLSPLAVASALGMSYADALEACSGVMPRITLPDLPGIKMPTDIAPRKSTEACPDSVIARIRQMRDERYSRKVIAEALGVSVATVANYAPFGQNARPNGADGRVKVSPEMHREIHHLRFTEHLSFDKIALKTGLSVLTVRRYAKIAPQ